ncbi:hypothetical protein [Haloprofundus sp. MHR1]|uniref:hypothetical protein n=1 Tax=Haloprofundus sp. MHR1 TaxID=2572921 RepID=UPI0010BF18EC|nr:hypothetical protein [Haloprofundus sp. MHR1]QCJ48026.1 hypothetical protein FCF25_13250 [Haloprofundus sp. MHR1]
MYTGKTERPCCLCGERETVARLDLPPRAVTLMRNGDPIAWRDIVGEVSVHFCSSDWETVTDLVSNLGMSPLSRCNAAYASFDLREDFEALLNATRDEPDQTETERRFLEETDRVLTDADAETRAVVEAKIVRWALEDLGVTPD